MSRHAAFRCTRLAAAILLAACARRPAAASRLPAATAPTAARDASVAADRSALAAQRAWWTAFTLGDTATLSASSHPGLALTLSNARHLDLDGAMVDAASRIDQPPVALAWSEEQVRHAGTTAIVTSRASEPAGRETVSNRFLTVLARDPGGWRVIAAQSTRIVPATPVLARAPSSLVPYAGRYQAPAGILEVVVRDSTLAIVTPSGRADRLRRVGVAIFESPEGQVRMIFERDSTGRVAALTRMAAGSVRSFPRLP